MSTVAHTTDWEIKLKDYVSAPFKKITEYATGAQKRTEAVANTMTKAAKASVGMGREFKRNYSGLEQTLHKLEERQKQAFSTKHILAYQHLIDKTRMEMERLNAITAKAPTKAGFGSIFQSGVGQAMGNLSIPGAGSLSGLMSGGAMLVAGGVLAAGVAMKKSADIAYDYDTAMAKVNATAQLEGESLAKLKSRLVDIGSSSGGNFEIVPEAYEKILSQTGKVNLSLDILETALDGAKAGFTDIDTVSGALAQTLSAVGENNTTAKEVLDTLMMAKNLGAGEFGDFAQYLPQLIASGQNLSVNFKDTAGLFSYMTGKGQSAANAAVLIQNAFTALQKDPVMKGLQSKGIVLFDAAGNRRNIKDIFLDLNKKLAGMNDKQKSKFFIDIELNDAQAKQAFSVLTGDAEKFERIMSGTNDALGETNRQLEKTANYSRSWGDIWDKVKSYALQIGDAILPVVDWYLKRVEETFTIIGKVMNLGDSLREKHQNNKNIKIANETALRETKKRLGVDVEKDANVSGEAKNFYKTTAQMLYDGVQSSAKGQKNKIVEGESNAVKALNNVHEGKSADAFSAEESKTKSVHGDGGKVRNLTMNITMNNVFKAGDGENMDAIKRKITDAIVDSARDGMVTIGV